MGLKKQRLQSFRLAIRMRSLFLFLLLVFSLPQSILRASIDNVGGKGILDWDIENGQAK
jgi:hypothetical protein